MPITNNEEYIKELKKIVHEKKLVLDQKKAARAGASSVFNTELASESQLQSYWDNIYATNDASKPLIASLKVLIEQGTTVQSNTTQTFNSANALMRSTKLLAQKTEDIEKKIKNLNENLQKMEATMDNSPNITSSIEQLNTSMAEAITSTLKAYADSLAFYQNITIFKFALGKSENERQGTMLDNLDLLNSKVNSVFTLDEDQYYIDVKNKLKDQQGSLNGKRAALEAAQKEEVKAQVDYDAVVAALTAAETANG